MQQSIFGDTYRGVISPNVFHQHPYPTRYHGMNLTVPRFPAPYVERPYAVPSFMGVGASPDGLGGMEGAFGAVGFVGGAVTGAIGGALFGALVGHFAAHEAGKGALYGALGCGLVLGLMGGAGAAAVGAAADKAKVEAPNLKAQMLPAAPAAPVNQGAFLPGKSFSGLGCGCSARR